MKKILFLFVLFTVSVVQAADFQFNTNCKAAYSEIIALRFENGELLLKQEESRNPENLCPELLRNYVDFLKVFISEDEVLFSKLEPNRKSRINKLEQLPDDQPYKRVALAAIHMQWAFARLKFGGQYMAAAIEVYKSFSLLDDNTRLFPDFKPNMLGNGIMHIMVGAVPPRFQWMLKLVSLEGTINQGREELYHILDEAERDPSIGYLRDETLFYLSFIELNLVSDKHFALNLLNRFEHQDDKNNLLIFAKSTIQMRLGKNQEASKTLDYYAQNESFPFEYLRYLKAETLIRQLDASAAVEYMAFLDHFKGKNYRADALRKLGWIAVLKNDAKAYHELMALVLQQQANQVDADKQAKREAENGRAPNKQLLEARLLFDGGYYMQAENLLANINSNQFNEIEQLEFIYRRGRVADAMDNTDEALAYYHETIEKGRDNPAYFAANAALKSGEIYELRGDFVNAENYFRLCLDIEADEYQNSIHQKAQAGLDRIGKK